MTHDYEPTTDVEPTPNTEDSPVAVMARGPDEVDAVENLYNDAATDTDPQYGSDTRETMADVTHCHPDYADAGAPW